MCQPLRRSRSEKHRSLCTCAPAPKKSAVEPKRSNRIHAIAHVGAFERIDETGWPNAPVVIADTASEPLYCAHDQAVTVDLTIVNEVSPAEARKPRQGHEVLLDPE